MGMILISCRAGPDGQEGTSDDIKPGLIQNGQARSLQSAFTLLELVLVMLIIAIMAGIARAGAVAIHRRAGGGQFRPADRRCGAICPRAIDQRSRGFTVSISIGTPDNSG